MLRKTLKSKLPIEVYHFPDEMTDKAWREAFSKEYDVTLRVFDGMRFGGKNWRECGRVLLVLTCKGATC
jgi:hypothetical protein